jgi:hypothetical protein
VERVDNPVRVGWYTDHTLRLDRVALTIDDLRSFEQVSQGAVYADSRGEIVLVELDGTRTRLGTQAPDGAFAASDAEGLVAWVDVSDEPELRVYDLAEREVVSSESIGETARVLAMDGRMAFVYELGESYVWEWLPGWKAMSRTTGPGPVLDAAGGAVAHQMDPETLFVSHGTSTRGLAIPGAGAHLAPEGDYVPACRLARRCTPPSWAAAAWRRTSWGWSRTTPTTGRACPARAASSWSPARSWTRAS